jgi:hypothetical protein
MLHGLKTVWVKTAIVEDILPKFAPVAGANVSKTRQINTNYKKT